MTAVATQDDFIEPAYVWKPPRSGSLLPKVDKICRLLGEKLAPEQAYAVDVLTGRKSDGTPASLTAAVICARQNLKTYCLERIVLTLMLEPANDIRLIVWTSQQLTTCDETFEHFVDWFEGEDADGSPKYPFFAARLDKIDRGKGTKQIRLTNGRRLKFKARSAKSGQGLTGDVIVFDEGFAVEPEHTSALVPTLATRRRAMLLYGSSAAHPESDVLRDVVDQGRERRPGSPAYIEFCAPGSLKDPGCESKDCRHTRDMEGCSLDRRDYRQAANPLVGRIRADGNGATWERLDEFRRAMGPAEFAREFLGWHDPPMALAAPPITVEMWQAQTDPESAIADGNPVVLSPEIALDRKSASIGVAGYREDGGEHVELIDQDSGTDWILPRLLELAKSHELYEIIRRGKTCVSIIIDPSSPAGGLVDPLRREGIEPVIMTSREAATACGDMQDALVEDTVHHPDQSEIDEAWRGAVRRDLGDGGWALGRKKSAQESYDITPAVTVTNARWGLSIVEPEPDPDIAGFY